jgi:small subunit ribosomal protein S3
VGQKTSPIGFRLGVVKPWRSRWFNHKNMPEWIQGDEMVRKYLRNRLSHAAISRVEIERTPKQITVIVFTARPGVVIGRKGSEVDKLRDELARLTDADVSIKVEEVKRPELDAQLVADNIAFQLSQRISHRRAMKKAVTSAMRMGAEGIKIQCGGRLGGNEIARREGYHEGRVPLHTIRADIDFARSTAKTTFGTIGVKVWIFKGEVIADGGRRLASASR